MIASNRTVNGTLVLDITSPRIDAQNASDLRTQIHEQIADGATIVLNLESVEFIDSSGLGAIVSCLKRLRPEGDLIISGLTQSTKSLFKLTRMDQVFKLFESVEEATASS